MGPLDNELLEFLKTISSSLTVTLTLVIIIVTLAYICIYLYRSWEKDRADLIKYNQATVDRYQTIIMEINHKHDLDLRQVTTEAIRALEATSSSIKNLTEEIGIDEKLAAIRAKVDGYR